MSILLTLNVYYWIERENWLWLVLYDTLGMGIDVTKCCLTLQWFNLSQSDNNIDTTYNCVGIVFKNTLSKETTSSLLGNICQTDKPVVAKLTKV